MSDAGARSTSQDPQQQVLLQAPAGSGKTTVLVQRFLRLLAIVDEPEQVLAITFTRKAAAEMRDRVLRAIEGQLPEGHADLQHWRELRERVLAHAQERKWDVLELPTRLRIQTIDSLNHELARAMPLLGRSQASLAVVDDARELHLQAARNTLRGADADAAQLDDMDELLQRLDNDWDKAEQLLAGLLASRGRWLPVLLEVAPMQLADRIEQSLARIIGETLQFAAAALPAALLAEGAVLARASARNRQDAGHSETGSWYAWLSAKAGLEPVAANLLAWQAMVDLALTGTGTLRKQITVKSGFPPTEKALKARWVQWKDDLRGIPDIENLLRTLRNMPPPHVDATERRALAVLARVMLQAAIQLNLVFRDSGQVDHNEVAAVARQALTDMGEPTDLSLRQTLRVHHLLVDEYQDISPEQKSLIEALKIGWEQGDGRSLFLVGDPMQSIYLFRDSEVGLFLEARSRGVGGTSLNSLQLTRNFRSANAIVDWVNGAFLAAFPAVEDVRASAVPYLAAEAVRQATYATAVTVWPQASADPWPEAQQIAAECARLLKADPAMRCAILLQTRASAPRILRALRDARVPALGVDLAPLSDLLAVRDLVSLARAMLHAGDRTAWLSVLRAPFCGLTLHDLHALCGDQPDALLMECIAEPARLALLSLDGRQRLARCAPLLLQAYGARRREHLATHVETLWHQLGGPAACQDDTDLRAVQQFLLALQGLEQTQAALDAAQLQSLAQRLRAGSDSAPGGTVEVLTIHHAKGLEWDAVFLPGLGRKVRNDTPPLLRWLQLPAGDGSQDLLMAVRSIGQQVSSDPLSDYIKLLQKQRQDNERTRLAYVAVTRARELLYLSGHAAWNKDEQAPRPDARSQLQIMWPAVRQQFIAAAGAGPTAVIEPAPLPAPAAPWYRLNAHYAHAPQRSLPSVASLAAGSPASGTRPEFSWAGPMARAAGTLVHAEMEFLAQSSQTFTDFNARIPLYMARLRQLGVDAGAARITALDIATRMTAVARDPKALWLLSSQHAEAHSELRLTGVLDGQIRNVVIDRSFVDEQGQRWVIDYKTSSHSGGDLAGFLAEERERYRSQLQLYARLARGLGPQPVRAALFFPWLGELLEVS
ncbi:MAG: UvrD-helicase domain-containing protein [Pseudomonadota bacterium]